MCLLGWGFACVSIAFTPGERERGRQGETRAENEVFRRPLHTQMPHSLSWQPTCAERSHCPRPVPNAASCCNTGGAQHRFFYCGSRVVLTTLTLKQFFLPRIGFSSPRTPGQPMDHWSTWICFSPPTFFSFLDPWCDNISQPKDFIAADIFFSRTTESIL